MTQDPGAAGPLRRLDRLVIVGLLFLVAALAVSVR
jgi:hypothetical protein